jgi:CheY-like chemotaxis protein
MTRHVLVVDDEPDIRAIASFALERLAGWRVSTAGSGHEAVRLAAAEPPDAVVLDVMMPGMDGPDTVAALEAGQATRGVPVVLLTAKVRAGELDRLSALPVAGVLSKPFDPVALAGQLRAILGWDA